MPGAVSDYLENALLNHVFRGVAYTAPTAIYLALYTSDPTDANTGTEVSSGGYARQQVTFTTLKWSNNQYRRHCFSRSNHRLGNNNALRSA